MQPKVQSLEEIIAQLNPAYDPQRATLRENANLITQQNQAAQGALDAKKVNEFKGIEQTAQNRGMFFSGFSPEVQAKYLATNYLPAVANLTASNATNQNNLVNQLAGIDSTIRSNATQTQSAQQNELAKWQQEQEKLAQQLAIAQMQAQARLQAAAISASGRGSTGGLTAYQQAQLEKQRAEQYKVERKQGDNGYNFIGPGGSPLSMADYLLGRTGAIDVNQVRSLLQSGSSYDQRIANAVSIAVNNKKIANSPESILKFIAGQDARNYYGLKA